MTYETLRRISRSTSRRSASLDAYSTALHRLGTVSIQRFCEMEAGVPACPATLQAFDDARVIWAAARCEYMRDRLH